MNTMLCKCKICKNHKGELVNSLASQDTSLKSIQKQLLVENLDVTEATIQRHLEAFGLSSGTLERIPKRVIETVKKFNVRDTSLSKWGLTMSDPQGIVRYLQECQLKMYLTQFDITWQLICEYQEGIKEDYPSQAVNNLKKLWDLLDPITAISLYANQQSAMRVFQNLEMGELPELKYVPITAYEETDTENSFA